MHLWVQSQTSKRIKHNADKCTENYVNMYAHVRFDICLHDLLYKTIMQQNKKQFSYSSLDTLCDVYDDHHLLVSLKN